MFFKALLAYVAVEFNLSSMYNLAESGFVSEAFTVMLKKFTFVKELLTYPLILKKLAVGTVPSTTTFQVSLAKFNPPTEQNFKSVSFVITSTSNFLLSFLFE